MAQTAGGTYYAASSELVSSWPATSLDLANQLESRFAAKAAIPGAWTSFTPGFYNLTVGNGAVTAGSFVLGKIILIRITLVWGSTTTATGSSLQCDIPVTARYVTADPVGSGIANDISAGISKLIVPRLASSTRLSFYHNEAGGNSTVTNAAPFTWASGDVLTVTGIYEGA